MPGEPSTRPCGLVPLGEGGVIICGGVADIGFDDIPTALAVLEPVQADRVRGRVLQDQDALGKATPQLGEQAEGAAHALGVAGSVTCPRSMLDELEVVEKEPVHPGGIEPRRHMLEEQAAMVPVYLRTVYAGDSVLHGGGLREQLNELRRTVLGGFDSQGDRLLADMRAVLREPHPQTGSPVPPARRWLGP